MSGPLPAFLHPFARPAAPASSFTTIVGGSGATVWDAEGRSYVDALASLWYCNAGHGRSSIVAAITEQAGSLAAYHCFDRYTNEPADRLCEALADLAPMRDARVFLTSSGSEAVDSAIKLARVAHSLQGDVRRTLIVGRTSAYHGVTYGGLAAQGIPQNQQGFGPLVGDVTHVAHDSLEEMTRLFEVEGGRIAAVLAEPVIGAGGVHPPVPGYLEGVRELCTAHGAFLVFDEVICGFGRLGGWWGASVFDVTPDLVTFAKGVTSGYQPLGGVLVGAAVRSALEADPEFLLRHGHTYSGHPIACAAALANIDVLRSEDLGARAPAIGARLSGGLQSLVDEGLLAGVRGAGAIWAAVLPSGVMPTAVRDAMLGSGVIVRPLGADVVAFCPPLVITDDEVDRCVSALAAVLAAPA